MGLYYCGLIQFCDVWSIALRISTPSRMNPTRSTMFSPKKRQDNLRPVIYYLKHLLQDMDETQMLSRGLISYVRSSIQALEVCCCQESKPGLRYLMIFI